jgi:hypothetical protein
MSGVPFTFAGQAGPLPLAELDADFAFLSTGSLALLTDTSVTPSVITVSAPVGTIIASYTPGLTLSILVANTTTTTTPTINLNALGAKTIINANGTALTVGQIVASQLINVVYDGTNFRLMSQSVPVIGGTAFILALPTSTPSIVQSVRITSPAITHNSTGNYTVTHNLGTAIYGVQATVLQSSGTVGVVTVFSPTSSQISFLTLVGGSLSDAIGDVYLSFTF